MAEERTSVLVVGGALTGLSSAVFLAWQGCRAWWWSAIPTC
jgi:monoamine oxidase